MSEQVLGHRDDIRVAVSERERAREAGARSLRLSLRELHDSRSDERFGLGNGRNGWQAKGLFEPLKALGRTPTDQPEEQQPPCDVGGFSGTLAFDEPCQGRAVALDIVAHSIKPLGLLQSKEPLFGAGRL